MNEVEDHVKLYVSEKIGKAKTQVGIVLSLVTGFLAIIVFIIQMMKAEDLIDKAVNTWISSNTQFEIEKKANSQYDGFKNNMIETKNYIDNVTQEILRHKQESEELIDEVRQIVASVKSRAQDGPIMAKFHHIEVPMVSSTTYYDTNIPVAEFPAAVVGGWRLAPEAIVGQEILCKYTDVSHVFMTKPSKTWYLGINKTSGCNRMYVRVFYIPKELILWKDEENTLKSITQ